MFVRIRFAKYGVMKFIGHLDVMRYFQKAVRRSELKIKYSQGFNPHQIMVFASPLGVGITSDGEYMDIEIEDDAPECGALDPAAAVAETLKKGITEGFELVDTKIIPWKTGDKHPDNAMSLVAAADYLISLKDGYELKKSDGSQVDKGQISSAFEKYLAQDEIVVCKKTKSGERDIDIKPYIFMATMDDIETKAEPLGIVHADRYESDIRFYLSLSAGSSVNIKPELVLEDFCKFADIEYNEFAFQLHRAAMYKAGENGYELL